MDRAAVERFVRHHLGCGCPDEVFRDLHVEPADGLHDGAIHVGGRLLVLMLDGAAAATRLPALLVAGRSRRDEQGYNRVRIVVFTEDPVVAQSAERLFDASPARDERTHIHVVSPSITPFR